MTPRVPLSRSFRVTAIDTVQSATYNFLLVIGDFSRKIAIFFTPRVFIVPAEWVLQRNFVTAVAFQKTSVMPILDGAKSLTIYALAWMRYQSVKDRRTDGRTDLP